MRRRLAGCLVAATWLVLLAPPPAGAAALDDVTGTLRAKLKGSGRAEVQIERSVDDPLTGRPRAVKGQLALEPPAFARIEFPASGERVAVRADGCEWIQPGLEQMIRVPGDRLAGVLRWWMLFAGSDPDRFAARRVSAGRYVVFPTDAPSDSARVRLGKNGLPLELELSEGLETPTRYRFSGWKFVAPRGRNGFVLKAPEGYEVVDLP